MEALKARWDYLSRSTKGLAQVAIAMISLVTAIWGLISGSMPEAEREGRIILLSPTIAMAVVAVDGKRVREAALPLYARREQGQLRI